MKHVARIKENAAMVLIQKKYRSNNDDITTTTPARTCDSRALIILSS